MARNPHWTVDKGGSLRRPQEDCQATTTTRGRTSDGELAGSELNENIVIIESVFCARPSSLAARRKGCGRPFEKSWQIMSDNISSDAQQRLVSTSTQTTTPVKKIESQDCCLLSETPLACGATYQVHHGLVGPEDVCVKFPLNEGSCEQMQKEVDALSRTDHPSVLRMIGVLVNPHPALATEYCPNGSMRSVASSKSWCEKVDLVVQVAQGMAHLHSREVPIVHGALNCKNVLIRRDGSAAIAGFNSQWWGDDLAFVAPEVLVKQASLSRASDVFSFAMVMWEVLMGKAPWFGVQPMGIAHKLSRNRRPVFPVEELWRGGIGMQNYIDLMEQCWTDDPQNRPSFQYVVEKLSDILSQIRSMGISHE